MKKSKKNTNVSLTKIRTLLKEVAFNPRTPGPMSIISEVGSVEYYECRAIEEIRTAQSIRTHIGTDLGDYHQALIKAIQLLLLARLCE